MTATLSTAEAVAVWQDDGACIPFIKGRVALYAILRALDIGAGDEVLVPGFTCVVVPAAVCYTGATPVYYDIERTTLHGDPEAALALVTPRTRAVLLQHNFGMMATEGRLLAACRERGIAVIEDSAHSMGGHRDGRAVGTLGAAAFCSLQWSKPTTTGLGGIARFNDPALFDRCRQLVQEEFSEPSAVRAAYLGILSSVFRSWYRPSWYWTAQGLYRWAGKHGLVQGSSSPSELSTGEMPNDYREVFGQRRLGSLRTALAGLPALLDHRRGIHDRYAERLARVDTWRPELFARGTVGAALRYPVLVENRPELLAAARQRRMEIGDWFNAPLHPEEANPGAFGYRDGLCPHGEAAAARVINLPTHRHVDDSVVENVVDFLGEHARFTTRDEWLSQGRRRWS